jgi:hypothetical protein
MNRPIQSASRLGIAWLLLMAAATASGQTPTPAPPLYSLPFQLRPLAVSNTLRLDTSIGGWDSPAGDHGSTLVTGLIGSWKRGSRVAIIGRVSFIDSRPPSGGVERSGHVFSNPLVGITRLSSLPDGTRLALFGAVTLPLGGGGGASPAVAQTAALARGVATRSAMDNALFAVNYTSAIGGVSVARVRSRATLQAEATVLQLFRARGASSQDERRTNFTAGAHAGLVIGSRLSLGAEVRYQRWLTDAAPVRANAKARETMTIAFGPRLHLKLGKRAFRPGVSFTAPLDEPLSGQKYRIWQLDLPVSF